MGWRAPGQWGLWGCAWLCASQRLAVEEALQHRQRLGLRAGGNGGGREGRRAGGRVGRRAGRVEGRPSALRGPHSASRPRVGAPLLTGLFWGTWRAGAGRRGREGVGSEQGRPERCAPPLQVSFTPERPNPAPAPTMWPAPLTVANVSPS
jgi:hypothetical protein